MPLTPVSITEETVKNAARFVVTGHPSTRADAKTVLTIILALGENEVGFSIYTHLLSDVLRLLHPDNVHIKVYGYTAASEAQIESANRAIMLARVQVIDESEPLPRVARVVVHDTETDETETDINFDLGAFTTGTDNTKEH